MKLGRNDPCWCGSGAKYKKCHLDRESEPPHDPWKVAAEVAKEFSSEMCLVPEEMKHNCSGKIIKAHTVPRSGSLAKIAQAGHVYTFVPSLPNFIKNKGKLLPQLVGIKNASTFTGF
ncbi:MAG TPA: SEC-C metal-binding domain-containing protein [Methyloradius sp.]|nr:SEC-C metal-binding domain-containing protein [Methyloradius sp.]